MTLILKMGQTLIDKNLATNNFLKKKLTACFHQLTEQNIEIWRNFKEITLTVAWFLQ